MRFAAARSPLPRYQGGASHVAQEEGDDSTATQAAAGARKDDYPDRAPAAPEGGGAVRRPGRMAQPDRGRVVLPNPAHSGTATPTARQLLRR